MNSITPIKAFEDNYIWKISNGSDCLVVDPGDAAAVFQDIEFHKQKISAILVTHHHGDHIGGVKALKERFSCPVYGPSKEANNVVDIPLFEGDKIRPEGCKMQFQVIEVPGHTSGHISFYSKEAAVLFCGDTLFAGGCGRLFEGTPTQMLTSLNKFKTLPPETKIYCAHEYTLNNLKFAMSMEPLNEKLVSRFKQTNIMREQDIPSVPSLLKLELDTNPFLRVDQKEIFESVSKIKSCDKDDVVGIFQQIRCLKDQF